MVDTSITSNHESGHFPSTNSVALTEPTTFNFHSFSRFNVFSLLVLSSWPGGMGVRKTTRIGRGWGEVSWEQNGDWGVMCDEEGSPTPYLIRCLPRYGSRKAFYFHL